MMMSEYEIFVDQNPAFADLSEDERATAELYAQFHAGNMRVLWRALDDGWSVKCHEDWGGDDGIVVHTYHTENPDKDVVDFYPTASEALDAFLAATTPVCAECGGHGRYTIDGVTLCTNHRGLLGKFLAPPKESQ